MATMTFKQIEQKGRSMTHKSSPQHIGDAELSGRIYHCYLCDNFCLAKYRYKVICEGCVVYTSHFDIELVEKVEQRLKERNAE